MKRIGYLLVAGIIPVLVLVLFMKFVSRNPGHSLFIVSFALFFVSLWQHKNTLHILLKILLIPSPIIISYYLLIVKKLPGLWISIPVLFLAVVLGLFFSKRQSKVTAGVGLLIGTGIISIFLVPEIISKERSKEMNESAPNFELENLATKAKFNNDDIADKVVVLDFFGTYCAPCIDEMNDLTQVKSSFSGYEDKMEFIVACIDTGGDTPEKAIKFHFERQLPFLLAYDTEARVHRSFGFTGVPSLVILDKKGKMRFKHEGDNPVENLEKRLIPLLNELLRE